MSPKLSRFERVREYSDMLHLEQHVYDEHKVCGKKTNYTNTSYVNVGADVEHRSIVM